MPGPPPKPKEQRARRNKDVIATTQLEFIPAEAPDLPPEIDWHPRTVAWWETWKNSAQSQGFTATDWDFLLDTAFLHTLFWRKGTFTLAAEIRQRVATFGATPADRARLRMSFVDADQREAQQRKSRERERAEGAMGQRARDRYEGLRVVGGS